ncbi:tellurite resistance TerB family protein [Shewanella sp. A3A]|nr:tellurite resistance TerB family protein [Shewanella ferrihydritica]
MDLRGLLNQALNSNIVQVGSQQTREIVAGANRQQLATLGIGAAGGTLMGLLLGSRKSKKFAGTALKIGGAAALGGVAYKVYRDWQAKRGNSSAEPAALPSSTTAEAQIAHEALIAKAMIAAAKADGHVDEQESEKIKQTLASLQANGEVQLLFVQELSKPLDVGEIAKLARTPEQAAEVYLASLLMTDGNNFMERAYLDELARQLQLAPDLVQQLTAQARQ